MRFSDGATNGDRYGPAMAITDQAEANAYFEALVEYHMRRNPALSRGQVESIERNNLGYWAGYYDSETMERVNRLFRTTHPIFGATAPTGEAAYKAARLFNCAR